MVTKHDVDGTAEESQLTEFGAFLMSEAGAQIREALNDIDAYLNDDED